MLKIHKKRSIVLFVFRLKRAGPAAKLRNAAPPKL